MSELSTKDIKFLSGVGPKKAELLKKEIDVSSFEDMIYYFPYKYIDRSKVYKISEINSTSSYIQLKGRILSMTEIGEKRKQRLSAKFTDGNDVIELIWFKGIKFIVDKYKINEEYIIFGKPSVFNGKINIAHPDIETIDEATSRQTLGGLQGLYNTTERMKNGFLNSKAIHKIVFNIFTHIGNTTIPETLPSHILQEYNLLNLKDSLINIHFPKNNELLKRAQYRLKLEELFYIQLNILRTTRIKNRRYKGFIFENIGHYFNTFYKECLPFELTDAQKRVIKEIRIDVRSGKQMNRLLQGDVGSGKTLVALMVMLIALDNDFQACIMAPTEILANQHYESISGLLSELGVSVALLTGSTKKSERAMLHENLANGELKILIGTHALLEDQVVFKNLGMVIIDEQHRFGVAQRARLWKKNIQPPDR